MLKVELIKVGATVTGAQNFRLQVAAGDGDVTLGAGAAFGDDGLAASEG